MIAQQKTCKPLWRRLLRRLIQVTVTLLVVLFLVWSIWQYVVTKQLRTEIANIHPKTFAEFNELYPQQTPAADSKDAANTPFNDAARFYKAAFALTVVLDETYQQIDEAYDAYQKTPTANRPDQALQEMARDLLDNNKHFFELIAVASSLPNCTYDLEAQQGISPMIYHMGRSRAAARLLSLRTKHQIVEGNSDAAISSIIDSLKLLRVSDRQPLLIAHLLKCSIIILLDDEIPLLLQRSTLSDEQLMALHETISNIEIPHELQRVFQAERIYSLLAMHAILPTMAYQNDDDIIQLSFMEQWPRSAWLSPSTRHAALGLLRMHAKLIDAAGKPWPDQIEAINHIKPEGFLALMSMQSIRGTVIIKGKSLATQRATRIAILIERYQLVHGDPPQALNDLVPQFIDELPLDPFTGKSMLYRTDADGYVVYSVGENRTDDGGDVESKSNQANADWGVRLYRHADN